MGVLLGTPLSNALGITGVYKILVFVRKLRNGLTDSYEILYVDSVDLRMERKLYFITLSDKGNPPHYFLFLNNNPV